jgi:multiple sugar transport system substrate-binding protein
MEAQTRRVTRRDFLRLTGVTTMGVLAAACTAPAATTTTQEGAEGAGAAEAPEIVYLNPTDDVEQLNVQQAITDAFMQAHPEVKVRIEALAWDGYWEKLQTMIAGGVAPDMFRMDYVYMAVYASKGVPIALDDYVKAEIDTSQFAEGYEMVFQAYSYEGKQYALPQDVNTQVLFYNKQLFDEAGVDYPNESWKWDPETGGDFLEAAKALTSGDVFGYSQEWYWEPLSPWLWENGGDWHNEDRTQSTMSDPKTIAGIQFLADLLLTHNVSPTPAQMAGRGAVDMFNTGAVAMYQSGRWMTPTLRAIEDLDWDVAVLPEGVAGRATTLGGTASCISNQSKHPDETWQYAKWYLTGDAQTMIADMALSTPLLKSVLESKEFMESTPPQNNGVWLQSMAWIRPMPVTVNFDEVNDIRETELTEVWTGRKSVADACAAMDEQINATLG